MKTNSNSYTIIYSVIIVVIVAFLLAFVSSSLKATQDANVALDTQKQILNSLNLRDLLISHFCQGVHKLLNLDHIFCPDRETPLFHPRKRQQMFHQPVDRRDHHAAGTLQDPPHDLNPLFRQQVSVDIRRIKQQIPRRVQLYSFYQRCCKTSFSNGGR